MRQLQTRRGGCNKQKVEKLRGSFRGVMQDTFSLIFCVQKAGPIVAQAILLSSTICHEAGSALTYVIVY